VSLILRAAHSNLRERGSGKHGCAGQLYRLFCFPDRLDRAGGDDGIGSHLDGRLQASAVFQVVAWPRDRAQPTPLVVRNWLGEYYNNPSLLGNPTVSRDDSNIDFNWGPASPRRPAQSIVLGSMDADALFCAGELSLLGQCG